MFKKFRPKNFLIWWDPWESNPEPRDLAQEVGIAPTQN